MNSFARCTWPIGGCLFKVAQILGWNYQWRPTNGAQVVYLQNHHPLVRQLHSDYVEAEASDNHLLLMRWLAARNVQLKLQPYKPDEFGVASVLDVLLKWIDGSAQRETVRGADGTIYPAVRIRGDLGIYTFPGHENLIIEIPNQSDEEHVYMTMLDTPPTDEFGLINLAGWLSEKKLRAESEHRTVVFPMISFAETRDLDWMLGMKVSRGRADDRIWSIAQALQVNRLRMNEQGVRAQSAAVLTVLQSGLLSYVIDRPFLLWIERYGVVEPLFTAWLNFDSWMDPGGLE